MQKTVAGMCPRNENSFIDNWPNVFPYAAINGGVDPVVTPLPARICTLGQYIDALYGRMPVAAAWDIGAWGQTTAIVPVNSKVANTPIGLGMWTAMHMEYPFSVRTWRKDMEDSEGGNAGLAQRSFTPIACSTRIPGSFGRVLYVLVDEKRSISTTSVVVGSTAGGGVAAGVSMDTNGIDPALADANIMQALKYCVDGGDNANQTIYEAKEAWFDMYGATEDVKAAKVSFAEMAFAMPATYTQRYTFDAATGAVSKVLTAEMDMLVCADAGGNFLNGYDNDDWRVITDPRTSIQTGTMQLKNSMWTTPLGMRRCWTNDFERRNQGVPVGVPDVDWDFQYLDLNAWRLPELNHVQYVALAARYYHPVHKAKTEQHWSVVENTTSIMLEGWIMAGKLAGMTDDAVQQVGLSFGTFVTGPSGEGILQDIVNKTDVARQYFDAAKANIRGMFYSMILPKEWLTLTYMSNDVAHNAGSVTPTINGGYKSAWYTGFARLDEGFKSVYCRQVDLLDGPAGWSTSDRQLATRAFTNQLTMMILNVGVKRLIDDANARRTLRYIMTSNSAIAIDWFWATRGGVGTPPGRVFDEWAVHRGAANMAEDQTIDWYEEMNKNSWCVPFLKILMLDESYSDTYFGSISNAWVYTKTIANSIRMVPAGTELLKDNVVWTAEMANTLKDLFRY
jgi:hypothetical protein